MITIEHLMLLLALFLSLYTNQMVYAKEKNNNVREACSVTTYKDLCINSLAPFSNSAGKSPSKWARAGVSVTLNEVKNVQSYLIKWRRHGNIKGRNRGAVSDCIETFGYAVDNIHRSLGLLRRLSKNTFSTQMGDLNTWISSALTNEDTCLEGFKGRSSSSERQIKLLQNRVRNVSHITSNALALVNKLATTGLGSLNDP